MAKKNSSPTNPVTPPIVPPMIVEPGTDNVNTDLPKDVNVDTQPKKSAIIPDAPPVEKEVVTLEELSKQLAEMRENEAKRDEAEKKRQLEHEEKMKELDSKIEAGSNAFGPTIAKIVNDVPTRAAYQSKAERMKQKLAKEATKTIFIPKPATEPDGIMFHVQLNGFVVEIPKDQYVDVPITIWQTIVDSQKQIAQAGVKYRLDLNGKLPRLEKSIDPVAPSTEGQ